MKVALLADIGSTFTKLAAVSLDGQLLASGQAATTVRQGIHHGLLQAEQIVLREASLSPEQVTLRLSSSSAAGGLRMVTIGLVPELTAQAARLAALGAGARVEAVYSYTLTPGDLAEIVSLDPDIVLLAGGADGGDNETVLVNARALAGCGWAGPLVYAGNRQAAEGVMGILSGTSIDVSLAGNVMPRLGTLSVDESRQAIRDVFIRRIVHNRGYDQASEWASATIMPTPAAVQRGMAFLAGMTGAGAIMAFDVGGATTDVYSVGGDTVREKALLKGLASPREMRTVEADLGVRVSLQSLLAVVPERLRGHGLPSGGVMDELVQRVKESTDTELPWDVDEALAAICVEMAAVRHVGTLELLPTPFGYAGIQRGKDLSDVEFIVGTGGLLSRTDRLANVLSGCQASENHPLSLLPRTVNPLRDSLYIMYAVGLLSDRYPEAAASLCRSSLGI